MKYATFLILVLTTSLTSSSSESAETTSTRFRELMQRYGKTSQGFRKAEDDQQRQAAVRSLDEFPTRFIELAAENPADPEALKILRQAVQSVISVDSLAIHSIETNREAFPTGSRGGSADRIVELLLKDHLESDQLGPICDRMRWGVRKEFEKFLVAAQASNSHRKVQGMAFLAHAQLLHTHLRMVDLARDRPELIARYDHILGEGFFESINQAERSTLADRVAILYERATEFDDVINIPFTGTVAEKARTELHELRHLSIGQTAPEVEGRDQNGAPMKLSGFRGQVVLIYFWNEY